MMPREREALDFVEAYLRTNGVGPSVREIAKALRLKSTNGAHRAITALVREGLLRRLPNRARAIEPMPPRFEEFRFDNEKKQLVPLKAKRRRKRAA